MSKAQDFKGQKPRGNVGAKPGQPEKAPTAVKIQPDNPKPVVVFKACDPKLHTDASFRPGDGRYDGSPGSL